MLVASSALAVLIFLCDIPPAPSQCWICRPNPGSSAKNDQSSADDLQHMAHELAASKQGKSAIAVWNRALLHQLAGQAHYQDGTSLLNNAKPEQPNTA